MGDIKIQSFKLIKGGQSAEVAFKEDGLCPSEDDKACENRVHPDLIQALQGFRVHFGILTGHIPLKDSGKADLDRFVITGFAIGGSKKRGQGIVITGHTKTEWGTITANTRFRLFEEDPKTAYPLMGDILQRLEDTAPAPEGPITPGIFSEIIAYLREGKKGIDPQGKMDFPPQKEEPKKGGKSGKGGKVTTMKVVPPAGVGNLSDIPPADPDAQQRVADGDSEDPADVVDRARAACGSGETKEGGTIPAPGGRRRR